MKTSIISNTNILRVRIEDVMISDITRKLYDYSNRENEIDSLMESISEIGQSQPIKVLPVDDKYIIVDGVLRYMSLVRLKINEIDVIVSDFEPTDECSLTDYIIHNQIRKEKTKNEKLNEIRHYLRIDGDDPNPLRDKEKRLKLVSSLMGGKGWGRNNVYNLDKILRWEKEKDLGLDLSQKVVSNECNPARALDVIDLVESQGIDKSMEDESGILKGFVEGKYEKDKTRNLVIDYKSKKNVPPTHVDLFPIYCKNYRIIQGNIEKVELPEDLKIDTIFTSPPYYKLIKYGDDPNELGWEETPDQYVKRLSDILMKCMDRLKDTGSMFVNIGETYEDFQCLGVIDRLVCEMMKRGVRLVDKIIWNKPTSKPINNKNNRRFYPGYEMILHFSKTKDYYFDNFKIEKDKKLRVSHNCKEKGVKKVGYHIPNRFGTFRNVLNSGEILNVISVQVNKNRTKHVEGETVHPATFSFDLPLLPLLVSCPKNENTVVFDPFMGSGSCGVTSLMLGFKFVGVELYDKNIVTAHRLLSETEGEFDINRINSIIKEVISIEDDQLLEAA
jgi:DNA modification methylase